MARKRIIDTDKLYLDSPDITDNFSPLEILIYIRLWGMSEDWGGFEWNVPAIKYRMGGVKASETQIRDFLDKMTAIPKIIYYKKNGKEVGWIINFIENQRGLTNPSLPRLPLPGWVSFEEKKYPKGKSYAEYTINEAKLQQVIEQYTTPKLPVKENRIEQNRIEVNLSKERAAPEGTAIPFFTPIKNYFISAYKKKYDSLPAIDFGKDGRIVNKARGVFKSVDEAYKLIDIFLDSSKAEELGFTLAICFSTHTINLFKARKLVKSPEIIALEERKESEELARKKREKEIAEKKRVAIEEKERKKPENIAKTEAQKEKIREMLKRTPIVKKI